MPESGQQCIKRIWKLHLECLQAPCILQQILYPLSCILTRKAKGKRSHLPQRTEDLLVCMKPHKRPANILTCQSGTMSFYTRQESTPFTSSSTDKFPIVSIQCFILTELMMSWPVTLPSWLSYFPMFFTGHKLQVLITSSGNCVAFSPVLSPSHFILFP